MTALKELIQRHLNPFDPATFKPGNFWQESQNPNLEVDSIHQPVLQAIETTLNQVAADRITRTILLAGDSGSGKSYLLGRLKRQLNAKAFFAYIGPWPDSDYLWRHTLRNTVDSLIHVPEGQTESQLLLWLKSLPSLRDRSLIKWMMGERKLFIRDLRASFPTDIYNAREFFGVLYDLATNPDLRMLAYDWLKGDDLDEEDLKALRVKHPIDSEDAAQKILSNIGRIAASTQPIVLCFDNLDNVPILENGRPDLQSLFNLNTTIHNEKLSKFLVLISIINNTWRDNAKFIQPADQVRISQKLQLKPITLNQAEALWAARLAPIHAEATPKPENTIAPLSRDWLEQKFPRGKTLPRNALMLGQQLIAYYKQHGQMPKLPAQNPPSKPSAPPTSGQPISKPSAPPSKPPTKGKSQPKPSTQNGKQPTGMSPTTPKNGEQTGVQPGNELASFQLIWEKEFKSVREQVKRISQFTSPELVWRLREVLDALAIPGVKDQFLQGSKYAAYSLSHQNAGQTGIVWSEDRNMTTFYHVMNACQKMVDQQRCDRLYLIRSEGVGQPKNKGNQIYRQVFSGSISRIHLKPTLASVHYLETYHRLANAACGGELVIGQTTPNLQQLQALIRELNLLSQCPLLQGLGLVATTVDNPLASPSKPLKAAQAYVFNLMKTQQIMGFDLLVKTTQEQFSELDELAVEQVIQQLCTEQRLQLLDAGASRESQLICLVPSSP